MADFEGLIKLVNVETSRTDLDNLVNSSVEEDGTTKIQVVEQAINDAIKAVSLWYPYDFDSVVFTTTTTKDQGTYSLPSNLIDIESIRHTGTASNEVGDKLDYHHPTKWDDIIPNTLRFSSGKPSAYTRHGKNFELWRIPDDVYTLNIRAVIAPGDLSVKTDVPRIDEWWHRAIVEQASYLLFKGPLREEERALLYKEEADTWKALMRSREQRQSDAVGFFRRYRAGDKPIGDYWKNPFIYLVGGGS